MALGTGRRSGPESLLTTPAAHRAAVAQLQAAYAAIPPGSPVRLAKSHLEPVPVPGPDARQRPGGHRLDVSAFGRVLSVDPDGPDRGRRAA